MFGKKKNKKNKKTMKNNKNFHKFHIVNKSPWPILMAFSTFAYIITVVLALHGYELNHTAHTIGTVLFLIIIGFWTRDVVYEGFYEGKHTTLVATGLRLGFTLFIVSEIMFFAAFFWAFFHSSLAPTAEIGSVWPPVNYPVLDPFGVPFLNTVILLFSGLTITIAHHYILLRDHKIVKKNMVIDYGSKSLSLKNASYFLILTILLAILFTFLQVCEYRAAEYNISDGIYGSVFYIATGFHGFHVIVGTLFIVASTIRCIKGHFSAYHHVGFEAAAWYWHFVDVVWLFLFISVYWWGNL